MKLLLTSSGISNKSILDALIELLGKPIAESSALFIPTAMHPYPRYSFMLRQAICGHAQSPFCELGWKSLGILELTALPTIRRENWVAALEETDALLVWGGDVLYLAHWMHQSGLAALLPSLLHKMVYVGVSAGSMAASATFAEAYTVPPHTGAVLSSETIVLASPDGEISRTLVVARGAGLIDFAVIPHLDHEDHSDASLPNAEIWAAEAPVPVYAIDDQTAIRVLDGKVEVVSEGHWKLFHPES